ncbi:MAG: hypothetical protein ACSNEK_07005 [Parachlamydiaceae bacterium]
MFNFIYSFITFITAIFLSVLGFGAILASLFTGIRSHIATFILANPMLLFLFGLALFVCGIALVTYILLSCKRKYVTISPGTNEVLISETLVLEYLKTYWQQLFPENEVTTHLTIKKNKITITANLPAISFEEQRPLLQRIENEISYLFREILGYQKEIEIVISFSSS